MHSPTHFFIALNSMFTYEHRTATLKAGSEWFQVLIVLCVIYFPHIVQVIMRFRTFSVCTTSHMKRAPASYLKSTHSYKCT